MGEGIPHLSKADEKKRIMTRLARVEGQLRGIQQMIDREESCEKVAQQLAAARAALNRAFFELVTRTLEHNCLEGIDLSQDQREQLSGLMRILAKYG